MDGAVRVMTEQSLEVLRFYHLKELACDATIASMFLILYDTGRFFYIFFYFEVLNVKHRSSTVLTMGQEVSVI